MGSLSAKMILSTRVGRERGIPRRPKVEAESRVLGDSYWTGLNCREALRFPAAEFVWPVSIIRPLGFHSYEHEQLVMERAHSAPPIEIPQSCGSPIWGDTNNAEANGEPSRRLSILQKAAHPQPPLHPVFLSPPEVSLSHSSLFGPSQEHSTSSVGYSGWGWFS
jgi:hypothetical protein